MRQVFPAASELVQVDVSGKSPLLVPIIVIAVIVSVALPEFLRVTDFTGLVTPVATAPKFRLVGVRVTAGLLLELKVAVTALAAVMVTLQVPIPEQAPLQPAKVDPVAAVAVRVTTVPLLKLALQVLGQVMPAGLLLTEPAPVPASVRDSRNEPDGTLRKTVSTAKSETTQFASAEPQAVRLKVTDVMLA